MRRLLVLAAAVLTIGSASARAATIDVSIAGDIVAADGRCSLREAVSAANTDAAVFPGAGECAPGQFADTIVLPAGTYTLAIPGASENANATGDLDLTSAATIVGAGAGSTTIDADGKDRALDVLGGSKLTISDVTITGGHAPNGAAGDPMTAADADSGTAGDATAGPGGAGEDGGGVRSTGALTISDAVITASRAGNGGAGGAATAGSTTRVSGGTGGDTPPRGRGGRG